MAKKAKKDSVKRNRILGLLLFLCGLLIAVSLVTHSQISDTTLLLDSLAKGDIGDLFSSPIQNKGGVLGVVIAYILLTIFGYLALFLPPGIWSLSYGFFFSKDIMPILRKIGFTAVFLYFIGLLFSLGSAKQPFISTEPGLGGMIGHFSAYALILLTGTVISYTIAITLILGSLIWVLPSDMGKHNKYFIRLFVTVRENLFSFFSLLKPRKRPQKSENRQPD